MIASVGQSANHWTRNRRIVVGLKGSVFPTTWKYSRSIAKIIVNTPTKFGNTEHLVKLVEEIRKIHLYVPLLGDKIVIAATFLHRYCDLFLLLALSENPEKTPYQLQMMHISSFYACILFSVQEIFSSFRHRWFTFWALNLSEKLPVVFLSSDDPPSSCILVITFMSSRDNLAS